MGTAVGMIIAIVPQLVPVANEVTAAIRKTIAGKRRNADPTSRRRTLPGSRVPRTVVDACLVADIFESLPLQQSSLIPLTVRAAFQEGVLMGDVEGGVLEGLFLPTGEDDDRGGAVIANNSKAMGFSSPALATCVSAPSTA